MIFISAGVNAFHQNDQMGMLCPKPLNAGTICLEIPKIKEGLAFAE
jgi:hypothetical protein